MPKHILQPAGLPDPSQTRAYSHGVRVGNTVYLAGQTGHDAAMSASVSRFEAQTRRTFERMRLILEAAGGSIDDLAQVTVYITDLTHWPEFNAVYEKFLSDVTVPPARAVVPVSALNKGALVEIQAIAVCKDK